MLNLVLALALNAPITEPAPPALAVTPRDCIVRYLGRPTLAYLTEDDHEPRLVCITVFNTWYHLQLTATEQR